MMDARQLHAKVQELKEDLMMALVYGGTEASVLAVTAAQTFLSENCTQVLDILDDALFAYLENNGKLP